MENRVALFLPFFPFFAVAVDALNVARIEKSSGNPSGNIYQNVRWSLVLNFKVFWSTLGSYHANLNTPNITYRCRWNACNSPLWDFVSNVLFIVWSVLAHSNCLLDSIITTSLGIWCHPFTQHMNKVIHVGRGSALVILYIAIRWTKTHSTILVIYKMGIICN